MTMIPPGGLHDLITQYLAARRPADAVPPPSTPTYFAYPGAPTAKRARAGVSLDLTGQSVRCSTGGLLAYGV